MVKFSIVPDMLKAKGIRFFDETGIDKTDSICKPLKGKPINVSSLFQPPYLIIDSFRPKTTRPENIKVIDNMSELKKLGFIICSIKSPGLWFKGQQVTHKLSRIGSPIYGSKILRYIPPYHKCEIDINNKLIRICGKNAGRNGYGGWLNLSNEMPEKSTKISTRPTKRRGFGRYFE